MRSHVASDIANTTSPSKDTIVDIFAGAGGNAIAFASSDRWTNIIAIEKDPSVIACAKHNAEIYGVADRITFINDDSFSYLPSAIASGTITPSSAVIFASPPWGGPSYRGDAIFDLAKMEPYNLRTIYDAAAGMDLALYLPRTSDLRQIAKLVPDGDKIEVVQYCMEGASKAMVAYLPGTE